MSPLSLTKKLNRITNRNLGTDAKAGYKEYEVELPKEEAPQDKDINLEGDDTSMDDSAPEHMHTETATAYEEGKSDL